MHSWPKPLPSQPPPFTPASVLSNYSTINSIHNVQNGHTFYHDFKYFHNETILPVYSVHTSHDIIIITRHFLCLPWNISKKTCIFSPINFIVSIISLFFFAVASPLYLTTILPKRLIFLNWSSFLLCLIPRPKHDGRKCSPDNSKKYMLFFALTWFFKRKTARHDTREQEVLIFIFINTNVHLFRKKIK